MDAVFGFSFDATGEIRAPFDKILADLTQLQKDKACHPIVSVDIPSAWHVEQGNINNLFEPEVLVSLTAPKLGSKDFKGAHYLGGRFLPRRILEKYACVGT